MIDDALMNDEGQCSLVNHVYRTRGGRVLAVIVVVVEVVVSRSLSSRLSNTGQLVHQVLNKQHMHSTRRHTACTINCTSTFQYDFILKNEWLFVFVLAFDIDCLGSPAVVLLVVVRNDKDSQSRIKVN